MRFAALLCVGLLVSVYSSGQNINVSLQKELDSIYVMDQKFRELMHLAQKPQKADSLAKHYQVDRENLTSHLWDLQNEVNESNLQRVEEIIKQYGYPGTSMVGSPTDEAVFYVIQHSEKIDQYIPIVEKAAKEKQLPFRQYAMMLDRWLVQSEKEQVYGTQAISFSTKNKQTGKAEQAFIIWPVSDPANVNQRRKEAGFELTVEENAKRLQVDYRVLTLEEVLKMKSR
ncbi:hypothetical protein DSL64_19685 [Dyadobacter luteus]|uniref:DUF4919 domain-containing protein n=1 Tax=Dyadobacter luteus TaxID=2259619 RepID=A0A3D8Y7B8_9BACT|nr:DUF6624 domain-containing protein [Dyadobacter luteus]REA58892.1 hypothetical protein DSL64_19685 [Dyadobacter luteus]